MINGRNCSVSNILGYVDKSGLCLFLNAAAAAAVFCLFLKCMAARPAIDLFIFSCPVILVFRFGCCFFSRFHFFW